MKKAIVLLMITMMTQALAYGQDEATLLRLVRLPLKSISVEYPNKTGQVINDEADAKKTPSELHPVFFGAFDWHSSVHSHWMLVHTLHTTPTISLRDSIVATLDHSLVAEKLQVEADYFDRPGGAGYERTYGWAWLLKLDEALVRLARDKATDTELARLAQKWHTNMKPLTQSIVKRWKAYLPKMTYADRIGTHTNSAFGLAFALDWADLVGDKDFAEALRRKATDLYAKDSLLPAEWEPNATDFFSPSLIEADLMKRVLAPEAYVAWVKGLFSFRGLERVCTLPIVSDLSDYHIVHLVGLSFSRAWCMASVAKALPEGDRLKARFEASALEHYEAGMSQIFRSNYGGDHWLGTFAAYAFDQMKKD